MRVWVILLVLLSTAAHAEAPPLVEVLPTGVSELGRAYDAREARLDLYLDWPDAHPDEVQLEDIVRAALADADDAGRKVRGVIPWVVVDGAWVPLPALLPVVPVPTKPWEHAGPVPKTTLPTGGRARAGALSGKHVYVSAGHGFTWTPALDAWATQRGNNFDMVEDLISAETIDQYLVSGLENAGATVWTVRERDMSPTMRIVDDLDASATGTWTTSTSAGFGAISGPWLGNANPFAGGTTKVSAASATVSATMTWPAQVTGDFGVYVSWSAGSNRVADAHYVVRHSGGESELRVDQTRHGSTWVHLGRFHFSGAADEGVVLLNDTHGPTTDHFVAADAVRFGGGMGDFARGAGEIPTPKVSGRPRWEESARYAVQYQGAPTSVYAYTADERDQDVGGRSRYADWQHEPGEDAIYVAWHTNAPDPGRGTSTFVYGPNPPDGSYDFTGITGSDDLAQAIHTTMVVDIRSHFDASWRDRGVSSAYFGEINPSHNDEMPSTLIEVAFHSTEADAAYLKQPRFREVAARAYVRGIIRYFAARDGVAAVLPPERPRAVRVVGVDATHVRVSWSAPEDDGGGATTGYRVYVSEDGRGFDDGVAVDGTSVVLDVAEGVTTFVKVSATNAGGESFASPVLAARTGCAEARVAFVMGFYRLDAAGYPRDDLSAYDLGSVIRGRLAEVNAFDYVIQHAAMLGVAFDGFEADGLTAADVAPYRVLDWQLGEESTVDETFSSAEQALVSGWLGPDELLIVSGAELAWDLGAKGSVEDQAFLASLGATYGADDAGTTEVDDMTIQGREAGLYDVDFPDVLTPVTGAEALLHYSGGAVAATRFTTAAGAVAILVGVPLEVLGDDATRNQMVAGWLQPFDLDSGCTTNPEPEAEPVVEAVAEVDVEPSPEPTVEPAPDANDGPEVRVGRPVRVAHSHSFTGDDGCGAGDPSAPWLVLGPMIFIGLWSRVSRSRGTEGL